MPSSKTTGRRPAASPRSRAPAPPPDEPTLLELARSYTAAALKTLAAVMADDSATASARVTAAIALLDRGHGRPPQLNTGDPALLRRAMELSDDELAAIAAGGGGRTAESPADPPLAD
ncbi:MAG: hypothetical protein U1E56_02065 [Bauldia sp.]